MSWIVRLFTRCGNCRPSSKKRRDEMDWIEVEVFPESDTEELEQRVFSPISTGSTVVISEVATPVSSMYCYGLDSEMMLGDRPIRELPTAPLSPLSFHVDPAPVKSVRELVKCFERTSISPSYTSPIGTMPKKRPRDSLDMEFELRRFQAMKRMGRTDQRSELDWQARCRTPSFPPTSSTRFQLNSPYRSLQ